MAIDRNTVLRVERADYCAACGQLTATLPWDEELCQACYLQWFRTLFAKWIKLPAGRSQSPKSHATGAFQSRARS